VKAQYGKGFVVLSLCKRQPSELWGVKKSIKFKVFLKKFIFLLEFWAKFRQMRVILSAQER